MAKPRRVLMTLGSMGANEMLRLCKEVAPVLFEKAGPGCVRGACPEGAKTCGKAAEMRKYYLSK